MLPNRKYILGLIYGLTAGLIFSLFAWGLNAFLLAQAHFAYAWLAFLLGILPVMLITGLAGWLTMRLDNALFAALIWLAASIPVAILGARLPLWLVPELLNRLEPVLKGWVQFAWTDDYNILVYLCALPTAVIFIIAGLAENVQIEQASFSPYKGAIIMPLIICTILIGVAGGLVDNFVNSRNRSAAQALDQLFSFTIDSRTHTPDPVIKSQMRTGAVSMIESDISDQRRLFYYAINETTEQTKILVDLQNMWALCDVSQNQPVFCLPTEPPK